jgi:hypothetical protein
MRFSKPGATDAQFQKDRYACIQQARTPVSRPLVDAYGGSGASNVYVDRGTSSAVWLHEVTPSGLTVNFQRLLVVA